ncbi:MAG: OmpA family protein [Bacteroidales bacterium]|nr:OmpA family protein [Bacteroidales bacterium]
MAVRWFSTGILLIFVQCYLWSQEDVKIPKRHFMTGIDIGFKEAWNSVKEGDKYFKQGIGTFDLARDLYLFAHQYNPENAELNYKLGACYLFTDNKYEAIDYLHKAFLLNPEVSKDIHLLLGKAFHLVLEFDNAIEHYNAHGETLEPSERVAYSNELTKRLTECQHGRTLSKDPVRVIIQNLGEGVNSKYDDYNPIFTPGDTALYFTSRRPVEKSKRNPIDNKYNEDIYRALENAGEFADAVRLGKPFNSSHNNSLVGISPEGDRMLIYRGHVDGGDLQITSFDSGKQKWKSPKSLPNKLKSKDGETSACLSPDGEEFFFVSRNKKLTIGGKDILISRLDRKGKWTEPHNLSNSINTEYDEEGVFITADGKHLYFSSKGHNSMGGYDIFRSERDENGAWSKPVNLGYPINTPDDEVFFITDQSEIFGYYAAIREGGLGAKDIYKIIFLGSEKELITRTKDQLVAGPGPVKTGFLTKPQPMQLDTTFILTGQVLDTINEVIPVVAKLAFIDPNTGERDAFVISDTTGSYTARLPQPKIYGVEINAAGYLYFLDILDLTSESNDDMLLRNFYLQKVEVGTKMVLDNIYFETGKAVLRPESYDALDQVHRFLENNPTMKLEISGHTDNTGSLRVNQRLSGERAKAVVDYLIGRGISDEMLVYKGYADTEPVAPNNTKEGREQNRRVEFKVLSK